jgi:hypothetical protein
MDKELYTIDTDGFTEPQHDWDKFPIQLKVSTPGNFVMPIEMSTDVVFKGASIQVCLKLLINRHHIAVQGSIVPVQESKLYGWGKTHDSTIHRPHIHFAFHGAGRFAAHHESIGASTNHASMHFKVPTDHQPFWDPDALHFRSPKLSR